MRPIFYYILAAISGGVVAEVNKPINQQSITARHLFVVGMTSVVIGIIFGLGIEHFTGSTNLAIAGSALAGVGGFSSIRFIGSVARKTVESKTESVAVDKE